MKNLKSYRRVLFISLFTFIFFSSGATLNEARACCGVKLPAPVITRDIGVNLATAPRECLFGVNRAIGNLTVYHDLTPRGAGAGFPIKLRLAHNSLDLSTGPLGRGWTHNYNIRLEGIDSVPIRASLFSDYRPLYWWVWMPGVWRWWSGEGEIIDILWDGRNWRGERVPDGNYTFSIWAWAPGTATSWITGTVSLGSPMLIRADGARDHFTRNPDGTFTPEPGVFDTLIRNPDDTFTLTKKDRTTYLFDPTGNLKSIRDRNNNTTTLTYDAGNRLIFITDPFGRTTTLFYDGLGRIVGVTDPLIRTTTFSYDVFGNLITITDPKGGRTSFTHTAFNLIASVSKNGVIKNTFQYDTTLRVTATGDALGNQTTYTYQPAFRRTLVTDPRGNTQIYTYDERNNITSITDPLGNTTTSVYDQNNNLISRTDALGRTTTFTYDKRGNLTSIRDPLGNTTTFTYEPIFNKVTSITDPLGQRTTYLYDGRGNLIKVTDALGGITLYSYDAFGNMISTTDARGNTTFYEYDWHGNLITVTDPLGNRTRFTYDLIGRLITITDARGNTTQHAYDAIDRLTKITHPDGTTTRYEYDRHLLTKEIDANNNTISYKHDANDRLIKVTDALGNITRYSYDAVGNRISMTDANRNVTRYTYDAANRLIKVTSPLGNITTFTYDAVGNLIARTDANRNTTRYTYDALNRLIQITYPDRTRVTFAYDAAGRRIRMTDWHGITTYTYDALGRLLEVDGPDLEDTISYTYDPIGNRIKMIDHDGGITTFTYDALNRLASLTNPQGETTTYSYDEVGNLILKVYPNNTQTKYTFDNLNRLISLITTQIDEDGEIEDIISHYQYERDLIGNITRVKETIDEELFTVEYTYDPLYQLISEIRKNEEGEILFSQTFTYDPVGNRLRKKETKRIISTPGTADFDPDTFNINSAGRWVTVYLTPMPGQRDKAWITKINNTPIHPIKAEEIKDDNVKFNRRSVAEASRPYINSRVTYTILWLIGNRLYQATSDQIRIIARGRASRKPVPPPTTDLPPVLLITTITDYTYNKDNQLITETTNGEITTYTYDANGNRISKTKNGEVTTYEFDFENRLTQITFPDGTTSEYIYDGVGRRVKAIENGKVTRFLYDGLSVIIERDENNITRVTYTRGLGFGGGIGSIISALRREELDEDEFESFFYHYNHIGTVTALTDYEGEVVQRYTFDAFGNLLIIEDDDIINPYRFSTKEYSPRSGLIFFGVRFYDPRIGRFITPDPWTWGPDDPRLLGPSINPLHLLHQTIVVNQGFLVPKTVTSTNRLVGPEGKILYIGMIRPRSFHRYTYVFNNPANSIDYWGFWTGGILFTIGGGLGWGGFAQVLLVLDREGNIGLVTTIGGGGYTAGGGVGVVVQVTDADTIFKLAGGGVVTGMGAGVVWTASYEFIAGRGFTGHEVIVGKGFKNIPAAGWGFITRTWVRHLGDLW